MRTGSQEFEYCGLYCCQFKSKSSSITRLFHWFTIALFLLIVVFVSLPFCPSFLTAEYYKGYSIADLIPLVNLHDIEARLWLHNTRKRGSTLHATANQLWITTLGPCYSEQLFWFIISSEADWGFGKQFMS